MTSSKPRQPCTSRLRPLPSTSQLSGLSSPAVTGDLTISRITVRSNRILDVTRQCVALVGRACWDDTLDARTRADTENQRGRFKIWAGTIGVFGAGRASTDARLRDDEDVKEVMIDLLLRLKGAIQLRVKSLRGNAKNRVPHHLFAVTSRFYLNTTQCAFLKPVLVEGDNDDRVSGTTEAFDGSEASLVLSIGGESSVTTVESKIPTHRVASLRDIGSTISRLYRLSAVIRKPTSLQEDTRVASFIEKVEDGPDASEFKFHVRWQIRFRLPEASDAIVERLTSAVLFRRRKLRYRERHQQKLSQGLELAFRDEIQLPTTTAAAQRSSGHIQRQRWSAPEVRCHRQMILKQHPSINNRGLCC
ncbi:MAG: hypothetical protein Q9184_006419 [Pyrenodesmia sp. 2 TL-2023]